uniref:Uncharacterized protein n=1 Tax=Corvus moneduloides TaxID=1196302 RepID=A0A8U7NVP4_CORMO
WPKSRHPGDSWPGSVWQPARVAGDTGMAGKVLLVQPPWTPPVLWDHVTLTCHGLGTAAATTWYKDGQRWRLQGPDRFRVTQSGTYQCHRPDTGLSPPVSVSNDRLVLQVPARALLEGDTVTLRCRSWQNKPVTWVSFYREEKQLQLFRDGTELSLSPLRLHHSGRYRCRGWVYSEVSWGWIKLESAPVTVTVHGEHPTAATLTPRHPHTSLGQDGHRMFRAFSPELALTVTPRGHWDTGGLTQGHWDCSTSSVTSDPDVFPSVPSSGRRGYRVPPVPGPARGCHCGLVLVAPPGWVTMGPTGALGSWEATENVGMMGQHPQPLTWAVLSPQ